MSGAAIGALVAVGFVGYCIWLGWLCSRYINDQVSGWVPLVTLLVFVASVGALVGSGVAA